MKKHYLLLLFIFFCVNVFAQTANVFWSVNQDSSPISFPVATADITMTDGVNPAIALMYDSNNFQDVMVDVPFGTYNYTIITEGCRIRTGQVTVDDTTTDPNNPVPTVPVFEVQGDAVANVFWSVNQNNSPISFPVATADITMTDGVNPAITLAYDSNNFQDVMADVPFGTYDYTITTEGCRIRTGQVTVDCANTDPNNPTPTVAVFEVQGDAVANVFWSVNQNNSPISFPVATADITMTDGVNPAITLAYDSNNFQDVMTDVPFGTYDYTISVDCREDVTGTVTVDCANTDPNNPTPTVAVFEVQGAELTTANVFWSVNQNNSPISFPVATADITMTDGVNPAITLAYDSNNFQDVMADVPFGTYDYTITTEGCRVRTGQVTVDCANTDPNNPTPTVAVFEVQGAELTVAMSMTAETNMDANGAANASAAGGTLPYSYVWDTDPVQTTETATDLSSGEYNVTVTDASGCEVTGSTFIENIVSPFVDCYSADNWTINTANTSGSVTINDNTIVMNHDTDFGGTGLDEIDCAAPDGNVTVCITAPASGDISFDWSGQSGPFFNPFVEKFGYCLNGVATELTSLNPPPFGTSSGSAVVTVTEGDELCFIFASKWGDALNYAPYTITNFVFPGCQTAPLAVDLSVTSEILCNGNETGAIGIDITSGTAPYTMVWSNGGDPINLAAGEYCVTVTDADNAEVVECISISEPGAITIDIQISGEVGCFGGFVSATAVPSGGTGDYTIVWSNGEVGPTAVELTAGDNDVSVTDGNGCMEVAEFNIVTPAELTVAMSMTAETNMDANGAANASAAGGTSPYSYVWDTDPVQTTETATSLVSGDYNITVTDANGCEVTGTIFVDNMVGTRDFEDLTQFELFPNPSNGQVSVILELETAQDFAIQLYNNIGQQISNFDFKNTKTINQTFDWIDLPKGLYWISLISDGKQFSQKLIIK